MCASLWECLLAETDNERSSHLRPARLKAIDVHSTGERRWPQRGAKQNFFPEDLKSNIVAWCVKTSGSSATVYRIVFQGGFSVPGLKNYLRYKIAAFDPKRNKSCSFIK